MVTINPTFDGKMYTVTVCCPRTDNFPTHLPADRVYSDDPGFELHVKFLPGGLMKLSSANLPALLNFVDFALPLLRF
jgi:hypothetical protein